MRGRLARSAPNSDTRSTMVSSMGGNVGMIKGGMIMSYLLPWKLDLATPEIVKMCKCVGV